MLGDIAPDRLLQPRHVHASATQRTDTTQTVLPVGMSPAVEAHGRHTGETCPLSLSFDRSLDGIAFSVWLSMLLHARGEDVLRVKGLLNVGATGPAVLNGVQHMIHPPEHLEHWPDANQRSHLVFILHAIAPDDIVRSLQAFQHLLGANPVVEDMALLW